MGKFSPRWGAAVDMKTWNEKGLQKHQKTPSFIAIGIMPIEPTENGNNRGHGGVSAIIYIMKGWKSRFPNTFHEQLQNNFTTFNNQFPHMNRWQKNPYNQRKLKKKTHMEESWRTVAETRHEKTPPYQTVEKGNPGILIIFHNVMNHHNAINIRIEWNDRMTQAAENWFVEYRDTETALFEKCSEKQPNRARKSPIQPAVFEWRYRTPFQPFRKYWKRDETGHLNHSPTTETRTISWRTFHNLHQRRDRPTPEMTA